MCGKGFKICYASPPREQLLTHTGENPSNRNEGDYKCKECGVH